MRGVDYNQRMPKPASCPPWASIQLHGLFAHRSHKSHDTPSCRPWGDGVGTGSGLWRAVPSLPQSPALPALPAGSGPGGSAPGKGQPHRAPPCPGARPPSHGSPGSWPHSTRRPRNWMPSAFVEGERPSQEVAHPELKPWSLPPPCSPPSSPL